MRNKENYCCNEKEINIPLIPDDENLNKNMFEKFNLKTMANTVHFQK